MGCSYFFIFSDGDLTDVGTADDDDQGTQIRVDVKQESLDLEQKAGLCVGQVSIYLPVFK